MNKDLNTLTIRQSLSDDLPDIMAVYESAKAYMRSRGNHSQWTNGYPSEHDILKDMEEGNI